MYSTFGPTPSDRCAALETCSLTLEYFPIREQGLGIQSRKSSGVLPRFISRVASIWFRSDIHLKQNNRKFLPSQSSVDNLWKREDVAKYMNCAVRTVDELTASGVLPVIKLSKRFVRFQPSEVIKVLDQHTVKGLTN